MEKEMDLLRYHSFLNAVSKEFELDINTLDNRTQKRLLSLTVKIIDVFAEIYGDHELKNASNHISKKLASGHIYSN